MTVGATVKPKKPPLVEGFEIACEQRAEGRRLGLGTVDGRADDDPPRGAVDHQHLETRRVAGERAEHHPEDRRLGRFGAPDHDLQRLRRADQDSCFAFRFAR